jgi:hypothetical protein
MRAAARDRHPTQCHDRGEDQACGREAGRRAPQWIQLVSRHLDAHCVAAREEHEQREGGECQTIDGSGLGCIYRYPSGTGPITSMP